MHYIELHLRCRQEQVAVVEDFLMELGALAVTLRDAEDVPIYEPKPEETPLWPNVIVQGLFDGKHNSAELLAQATEHLPQGTCQEIGIHRIEDQEWSRVWMDRFIPMRFGSRLWVIPSHCDVNEVPLSEDAVTLALDPGLAFGTGTHPTTALCLKWLEANTPAGERIIDYGCGSGILAIAAAKLGASHVDAVDNDAQAITATAMNAKQNDVADVVHGYLPEQAGGMAAASVVVANILANILIALEPKLAELVLPGGRLVLSGILTEQADEVMAAFASDFEQFVVAEQEEWCLIEARRKAV